MAKLVRKTQKIFASGSAQNQVTSFGSIKAGAVDYTKDVADIQTEAFEGGWSSAVQDDYAPYRQDRNAVDFVTTSQLAYVFQEGLPEYDAGTTYYKGSWVKGNDGDAFSIYESLSDDNIGNALSDEEKWEKKSFGGGLEIGDIGIAPFGVDEAQNKRRYLNGQVISQAQFVSFTNKLKSIIQTYPSLAVSETNWQATVTNSKLGQCGKFVIDDAAGTIRLPKVVNINGLQDLSLLGGIKDESLPNITGSNNNINIGDKWNASGVFSASNKTSSTGSHNSGSNNGWINLQFDASRSSSTYQDNAPVQQEAIQYPYFIQVATGVEESVDVTREIELNNPFSLLDYKWSEYELSNASWLISNGAFHSGTVYKSVYELLLKIKNGTETKDGVSVKLVSEEYSDTDFVLNTADTTFRLPVRTASDYVVESKEATAEDPTWYRLYKSGWVEQGGSELTAVNNKVITLLKAYKDVNYKVLTTGRSVANRTVNVTERTEQDFKVSPRNYTDGTSATTYDWIAFGQGADNSNSKTYFYVGETVQDANVINAAGVLTRVANCIDRTVASDRETVVGWGMPDYTAGIEIPSGTSVSYTAPCDGVVMLATDGGTQGYITSLKVNDVNIPYTGRTSSGEYKAFYNIPLCKNDVLSWTGKNSAQAYGRKFFPYKGVN